MKEERSDPDKIDVLRTNDGSEGDEQFIVGTCGSNVAEYDAEHRARIKVCTHVSKKVLSLAKKTDNIKEALISHCPAY